MGNTEGRPGQQNSSRKVEQLVPLYEQPLVPLNLESERPAFTANLVAPTHRTRTFLWLVLVTIVCLLALLGVLSILH